MNYWCSEWLSDKLKGNEMLDVTVIMNMISSVTE
jgi:hypothetical protein